MLKHKPPVGLFHENRSQRIYRGVLGKINNIAAILAKALGTRDLGKAIEEPD